MRLAAFGVAPLGLAALLQTVVPVAAAVAATAAPAPRRGAALRAGPPTAEESRGERRAVRGTPVDDGTESPELAEVRRFEEQAFPRPGAVGPVSAPAGDAASGSSSAPAVVPALSPSLSSGASPSTLPGRWGGSGDGPAAEALSSGARAAAARAGAQPPPDSEWLRSLKLPDLPIRWDPQVIRYLEYFKSDLRGRAIMAGWLKRAGRFRTLIDATFERHGLPKDLLYVAMVESGFDTGARSRVGAGGIWQFMPGAARAYGLEVSFWVDARRDPERSAEAAARYLKDLYARFRSWPLVFAAYNAGYGAVLSSIARYNTNDYWELCRHENGLPWESSLYVPKIMAAAIVGRNLEAFGFADLTPDAAFAYDRIDAPPGTTLASVARAASVKIEALAALNPHLVRDRTPPDRGATAIRLPPGSGPTYVQAMESARAGSDRPDTVTLRFGETLEDVARARGTSVKELRRLNGVKDTSELRAGETILVPRKKEKEKLAAAARHDDRGEVSTDGASGEVAADRGAGKGSDKGSDKGDDLTIVAVPDRAFSYDGRERVFYRTRDGDRLEELAEVFGVRVDDLVEWNNLDPTAKLHPRMVLQVFVRKEFDTSRVLLLDSARVRVVTLGSEEFLELETARRGKRRLIIEAKTGETLAKIGRRYGLTTGDLARINRFSYNTELKPGQKVVVYSPTGEPAREVAKGLTPEPRRISVPETAGRARSAARSERGEGRPRVAEGTPTEPPPHADVEVKQPERAEKGERADTADKGDKGEKGERAEKHDRAERAEAENPNRSERPDKLDKPDRSDKADKPDRSDKPDKSAPSRGRGQEVAVETRDRDGSRDDRTRGRSTAPSRAPESTRGARPKQASAPVGRSTKTKSPTKEGSRALAQAAPGRAGAAVKASPKKR